MADNTAIEWTDATWNPITGCSVVSPGCTNCYAMKLAGTRLQHHPSRAGLTIDTKAGPVWNGQVRFNEEWLGDPARWRRPRMIFVCAHGDLFHESVPDEWIDRVFRQMLRDPRHTFQVLTKRAARLRAYMTRFKPDGDGWVTRGGEPAMGKKQSGPLFVEKNFPPKHIWLGVSAEDQERANERIPDLLQTPAAVRFVSYEPALGPVDFKRWLEIAWQCSGCREYFAGGYQKICPSCGKDSYWSGSHAFNTKKGPGRQIGSGIDWLIAGGESGKDARPAHPDWFRRVRDQCQAADVPFFFKQWGEWEIASEANGHHDNDMSTNGCRWVHNDGQINGPSWCREDRRTDTEPYAMAAVGKKAAGALLDGREHQEFPASAEASAGRPS